MCYVIHLSTTSNEDFLKLPTDHYCFEQVDEARDVETLKLLSYPHKWYLACRYGGCSCHYRHLECPGSDPWFGPPEDWCPEDEDDVESTAAVYDVLMRLVTEGHKVDILDSWNSEDLDSIRSMTVQTSTLRRADFQFFVGYRFDLVL